MSGPAQPRQSAGPRSIGTHREIAESNLARFTRSLNEALAGRGKANVLVVRQKLDDWLDYWVRHHDAGTLDEEAYL